jgi:mRNA-degrading endonuclease RelE of RelBE toxin-antitoxin system
MAYHIRYDPETRPHLAALTARQRAAVRDGARAHLGSEPQRETRNRFQMAPPSLATWELRLGELRVFYDVEGQTVRIRAVGVKQRNRLLIAGQEVGTRA